MMGWLWGQPLSARRSETRYRYAAADAAADAYADADAELKGKPYSEKKAWFRARIDAALADEIEASMRDAFELLDAMLALGMTDQARARGRG